MKGKITLILSLFSIIGYSQIENGMIAHLPFNNNFDDLSASGLIITNNGSTFTSDRNGASNYAIDFSGNNSVSFSDNSVKINLPVTISVWIYFDSQIEPGIIFTTDNEFENYYGYWMNTLPGTGQVALNIAAGLGGSNASNRRSYVSDMVLQTGQWYHVVGIIRSYNDMDIYIDCVQTTGQYSGTGSTSMTYSGSYSSVGAYIGNNSYPGGVFFDGDVDQFVIWNRELTANEILFMCDSLNTLDTPEILSQSNDNIHLNAYPNPSESNVIISFGKVLEIPELCIYNTLGELVYSEKSSNVPEIEFNIEKLASGTYIAKITDNNNSGFVRFVKE